MKERYWYIKDEEQKGPLSREEFANLIETKEITQETLIWTEGLDSWQPLSSLDQTDKTKPPSVSEKVSVRPWVRYWARMTDYMLFFFFVGMISGLFQIPIELFNPVLFGIFLLFLWVFIEAGFLSTWGFTPGKWLLNTKVRDQNGKKLSYRNALSRSLSVWWLGMGAGVPIISLITMIVGYVKLSKNGITMWDSSNECKIIHYHIGFWKVFLVILIFFIMLILMTISFLPQQQ